MTDDGARVEKVAHLLNTLGALRGTIADSTPTERRSLLAHALREALAGTSGDEADAILEETRTRLAGDLVTEEHRVPELLRRVGQLEAKIESLEAERARGSSGFLDVILDALTKVVQGKDLSAESIELPPREASAFALMRELVDFALRYELAVNALTNEFGISPGTGTMVRKAIQAEARERFRACLEGQAGAVEALKQTLAQTKSFLIDLNRAYQECLGEGSRAILAQMDAVAIAEQHKRVLVGTDYEAAWKTIRQTQSDLVQLSARELWERYYLEPFRGKLAECLSDRTE